MSILYKKLYDIIGDIHGRADKLTHLLGKLGYERNHDALKHPERKVIFLGDFINKGSQTKQALRLIRDMVETESARAVIGNHELNLICYFHQDKNGEFIRPHTEKNLQQHQSTFDSFGGNTAELQDYIYWMKTLPIHLETEGLRVAHAFWHKQSIRFIRQNYPQNCLDDSLLREMIPIGEAFRAVQEITVGLKLQLPDDQGGLPFKAKWWNLGKSVEYRELAIRPELSLGNPYISTEDISIHAYRYPEEEKPFFFGHYNLPGEPILLAHNYTCLDFNTDEHPLVVAYRWDGEQVLDSRKLVWV